MSEYLDLPTRSLDEYAADIEAQIAALEEQRERLRMKRSLHSGDETFYDLGEAIDRIDDKIGPLERRLEEIDDEIAFRNRRSEGSYTPIRI